LLYQQRAFPVARTLPGNGHAIDAAADYQDVKALILRW
jgi:hypothetical protein